MNKKIHINTLILITNIYKITSIVKHTPEDDLLRDFLNSISIIDLYNSEEFMQALIDRVIFYRFLGFAKVIVEAIQESIYYQNSKYKWENRGKEQS